MRLKLNRTLRAALIAAISAAGFTLSQAFAETATGAFQFTRDTSGHVVEPVSDQLTQLTIPWSDSQSGSFTAGTMADGTAVTGTWSSGKPGNWQGGAWTNEAALTDLNSTAGINLTTSQVSNLQSIGAWGGGGNTNITLTLKDGAVGQQGTFYMFTSSCDFTPTGFGVTGLSNTTITCASATGDGWDNVVTDGAKNLVLYKVTGTINAEQVTFTNSIGKNGWSAGAYTYNIGAATAATWQGTFESHNWADSVWDIGTFPDGGKAVFGAEGYNEVTVSSATTAASVSVSDQEYTFEIEDGGSLTAAKANIEASGRLTITGEGSASIISLSGAGNLTVGENGTATVNELSAYTGALGVADGGTLNLGSSITVSSLTVADGTVTTQHNAASGVVANTLTIGEGGTFKVIGGHDAFGYNNTATKEIVMQGSDAHHATLALEQNTGNSVTMTTNIVMHGYSDITVKEGTKGFNTYGGTITVDGAENTIDIIDLRNAVTINVGKGELSVGKFTRNGTNTGAVTKTGDGIMTITEASTLPGALNINGGTVSIGADTTIAGLAIATTGSLTVTGGTTSVNGSTNVIGTAIELEAGTLSLAGAYDISSLQSSSEPRYVRTDGIGEGSGFKESSGVVQVVNITAGATLTQVEGVTFTYGSDSGTLNEQGQFELSGAVDYTTLYVNNAEPVSYAAAWNLAQSQTPAATISTVVLANETAITADKAGASIALSLTGAEGTVNATEATTLSSIAGWDGNKLIIEGEAAVSLRPGSNIVMAAGTGLQVDTEVAAQKIQLNGAGANLTVADGGTLTTSNNLTLTTGVADIHGTVNVGHEVDLSDGNKATGTLHIHGGGDVTVKDGMWMATTAVGVLLDEDATYTITGKNVSFSGKEGGNGSIKASGAEVNYTSENSHAVITNLTMTALGDITIANTLNNVDVVTGEHAVTLNAAANSVTVGTDGYITFGTSGSASAITIEDGGVLGSYTKTGTGETSITSKGTAIMTDTIGLQAGKLTMTGEYNIDYLDGDVEITGYEGGVVDGNGFAHETGTIQVVNIAEGATLDATEGTFVRGGNDLKLTDGGVSVDSTNYAGFYINTESETVTTAKNMEYEHGPLSFIYVEEGATLVVNENINGSLVDTWSSGTVNIQESKTVTGTMEGVALAGSGTYDLGNTAALGTGTTLGEDWTGVVRLSNLVKEDGNSAWLSGLANGESWVELINFKGYDRAWASSFAPAVTANIILTDDADHNAAWNLSAYASTTYTMVLTGDVEGDGTFLTAGGTDTQSQAIEFRGDISGWEGAFVADAPGMRQVVFTGDASDVNASITKVGEGTLNLVVGNGSDVFDAVFSAEVSVSSVNVKANASATFLESTTATTVTNAGTVMFSTLEGLTQAITNTGDVIFNSDFEVTGFQETSGESGYFDLGGTFSTDGNGYAGTSDSYLTIVDGGTVAADNITVTQGDDTYTMNNSGLALKGDGKVVSYDTFYVNDGTVSYAAIADDGHPTRFIEVTGGTLDVDTTPDALTITVTGEGTLTGEELDVTRVHIEEEAIVHVTDGLVSEGVTFYAAEGGDVSITNTGRKRAYSTEMEDMLVQAGGIVKTTEEAEGNVTVSNILEVGEITNTQGGTLTLDGVSEAVEVKNLIIGLAENPAATVEMLVSGSQTETTVTVTETLAAGNGTLLANLVMADDSALLVGGVEKALHVGSTLTMGTNIALDTLTLQALDDLAIGEDFWLVDKAAGRELVYTGATGEDAWYDAVFSRVSYDGDYTLEGDFNIVFDEETDSLGLRKFSNTPEPTTGTLSLLALCALAARRRRK